MKNRQLFSLLLGIFLLKYAFVFSQNASVEGNEEWAKTARKNPVTFTHQPFLLLKFTPTSFFAADNALQFGAEIAPPIGKVSINFDYGIGKGKWNVNKEIRENFNDLETKLWRAEIRTYFSDLYPFYSLDKKPFGRYYAIEFMNKDATFSQPVAVANGAVGLPNFIEFQKIPVVSTEQAVNLKFGKHFILTRFLFLDAYFGAGIGRYTLSAKDPLPVSKTDENPYLFVTQTINGKSREIGTKGLFFSKTAGVRICLVL